MSEIRTLKCGLRVVLEQIPYVQSVTAGVWVKAGCADEKSSEKGISHFIEHMMFKGRRSAAPARSRRMPTRWALR